MILPENVRSLSPSSVRLLFECPESWRRSYVLGKWTEFDRASMDIGTAVHDGLYRLWTGGPIFEAQSAAFASWLQARPEAESGDAVEQINRMVQAYYDELWPDVPPVTQYEVKHKVEVEGVWLPVHFKTDLETIVDIRDIKTGRNLINELPARLYLQGMTYAALRDAPVQFEALSYAGKTATGEALRVDPTPAVRRRVSQLYHRAEMMISAFTVQFGVEQAWPGSIASGYSGCVGCGHAASCELSVTSGLLRL